MPRPSSWNVSNVLGYNYGYLEHTDKVNYARNVYDSTLDRSYEYDQVGGLVFAHSGAEARAAFGIDGQQWGTSDGPYSHMYDYDKQGNMTLRFGWGGEVQGGHANGGDTTLTYNYSNGKNQRDGLGYDAAGNLTNGESYWHYIYDAVGQQISAGTPVGGYYLAQSYDGDGLRGKKEDAGSIVYYLRSTVLGGAVVAELDASGGFSRGYFYRGDQLLAVQQSGHMYWVHEDAITKSKRTTDVNGALTSNGVVELDPWGANTPRSSPTVFQPQTFTGYTRDANGDSDARARRYSVTGRFPQPDPSGGSYDFSNPQSLNRYAYVGNDPVNFRDPSGMEMQSSFCGAEYGFGECGGSSGFWGGGDFGEREARYNREYAGMPRNMAAAFADYNERLQNTLDAIAANRELQQYISSEGTNAAAFLRLITLLAANPTLAIQEQIVFGPFVYQDVYDHFERYEGKTKTKWCATWVPQIAEKLGQALGLTTKWYAGAQVGPNTRGGTAIMSGIDANGRYPGNNTGNHAGFFLWWLQDGSGFAMLENVNHSVRLRYVTGNGGYYSGSDQYFEIMVMTHPTGGMSGSRRP